MKTYKFTAIKLPPAPLVYRYTLWTRPPYERPYFDNVDEFDELWRFFYGKLPRDTRDIYQQKLFELIHQYLRFDALIDEELTDGKEVLYKDMYKKMALKRDSKRKTIDTRARRAWGRGDKKTAASAIIELQDLPTVYSAKTKKHLVEFFQNLREDNFPWIDGEPTEYKKDKYKYGDRAKEIIALIE